MTDLDVLFGAAALIMSLYALSALRGSWRQLHYRDQRQLRAWAALLAAPTLSALLLTVVFALTFHTAVGGPLLPLSAVLSAAGAALAFMTDFGGLMAWPLRAGGRT